ncbi:MAG: adenylyl-sulfate kinase [Pseudomonadota bacterium]|nr:adenylyl-sulfate kinase [Pseudomonadota bacterium]
MADSFAGSSPSARTELDRTLLRFIVCGSVDDGRSTLIGRLLYEAKQLCDDQRTLATDSRKFGTLGENFDFSLLLDGLTVGREHGITMDLAHRSFASRNRHFIIADTPRLDQYTGNMVTGALTADVAVVLIDVRNGMQTQARWHGHLVSLLGIRKVVVAVNNFDLVGYSKEIFEQTEARYREFAQLIGAHDVVCIPISALRGDNVTTRSPHTLWYQGPTLLGYLDAVEVETDVMERPFRMVVQSGNRPNTEFRGFFGRVVSGTARLGDRMRVLPSGRESAVARIVGPEVDCDIAVAGQSMALTLEDEIDVRRGDMLADARSPAGLADQFEATIIWMADEAMLPGRAYLMKSGARTVEATVAAPKYRLSVDTLEHVAARTLGINDIGVCNLHLDHAIAFDSYRENRDTGSFILIDRFTNDTIGVGLIHFALRRSQNIHWQAIEVDKGAHTAIKGHRPCVVWFTGLSGAGKSTIANIVEKRLQAVGLHTYLLDGDNVRHGLNKDLGFTQADRVENIRRVAEVARLMVDAGLIVLVSFISPFRAERRFARGLVGADEFCEIFVDAPLQVAEQRDRKDLYRKARSGELVNFTGIDSPYEAPEDPELTIDTTTCSEEAAAERVIAHLRAMRVFGRRKAAEV